MFVIGIIAFITGMALALKKPTPRKKYSTVGWRSGQLRAQYQLRKSGLKFKL